MIDQGMPRKTGTQSMFFGWNIATNWCFFCPVRETCFPLKKKMLDGTASFHIKWCTEQNASSEKTQASIWLHFEELTMSKTPLQTSIVRNCIEFDVRPRAQFRVGANLCTARLSTAGAAPIPYMHPYIRPPASKTLRGPKSSQL